MRALRGPALALATFALSLGAVGGSFLCADEAHASVSIAVTFDALVKNADAVAIVSPLEHRSVWEDGRIYTYTHIKADQGIAGDLGAGGEGWVRTRGGVVDHIGQLVDGEPVFTAGKSSLVFLHKFKADGTWEVTERAQGQFAVIDDAPAARTTVRRKLRVSANVGVILPIKNVGASRATQPASSASPASPPASLKLASEVLHERSLDEGAREIALAWRRLHPAPEPAQQKP